MWPVIVHLLTWNEQASLQYQCRVDYKWAIYKTSKSPTFENQCFVEWSVSNYSLGYFRFVGITDPPGGSGYFWAAVVSLSNGRQWAVSRGPIFKTRKLGVCSQLLGNHQLNWLRLVCWPQDCISAFCQRRGFLVPLDHDLQHTLGSFAAEGEVTGMRVSTSSSKFTVLFQLMVDCSLLVGTDMLSQREWVQMFCLFMCDIKICQIDRPVHPFVWLHWSRISW